MLSFGDHRFVLVTMFTFRGLIAPVIGAALLAGCVSAAPEQDAAELILDARWEASLAAFAAADREHAPGPGGVLFVGSSSIRLWDKLEQQFDMVPVVINRGFGGSRMADCAAYVDQLVLPYRPRLVLVYAGDNDLAEGRTPRQVADSFRRFAQRVSQELPATRIAYISIKPSPARVQLLEQARAMNALIREQARAARNIQFIDVFTPMLDSAGRPRADLFLPDALHLNDDGYALWKSVLVSEISDFAGPRAARR